MLLTFRIASAVFAVTALYLAAALAIGPDDANAHLCAIADQLWTGAGTPCKTNLGVYALRVVVIIAVFCVIALVIDGLLWLRRAWSKAEPKKTETVPACNDDQMSKKSEATAPKQLTQSPTPNVEQTRVFVPDEITPERLFRFHDNLTDLQAHDLVKRYEGRWITVTGPAGQISNTGLGVLISFAIPYRKDTTPLDMRRLYVFQERAIFRATKSASCGIRNQGNWKDIPYFEGCDHVRGL
jgi:hypothetical protein